MYYPGGGQSFPESCVWLPFTSSSLRMSYLWSFYSYGLITGTVAFYVKCKIINLSQINTVVWICPENDSTDFKQKNIFFYNIQNKLLLFTSPLTLPSKKTHLIKLLNFRKNLFICVLKILIRSHHLNGINVCAMN